MFFHCIYRTLIIIHILQDDLKSFSRYSLSIYWQRHYLRSLIIRSTIGFIFSGASTSRKRSRQRVPIVSRFRNRGIAVNVARQKRFCFSSNVQSSNQPIYSARMLRGTRCGTNHIFDRCFDTHPSNLLTVIIALMMITRDIVHVSDFAQSLSSQRNQYFRKATGERMHQGL